MEQPLLIAAEELVPAVQYHLGKVFAKLNVTSRNQLARLPPSRLGAN